MLENKPLDGIRVLDLTRALAGPFCSMNLADLGAEVIKIELPGRGDDSRTYPPVIPNSTDSGYFYSVNRGKLSVTLDLRQPEGAEIALGLVRQSDIVVENFSAGTMARYGLGFDSLLEVNPGIILCSITGFGQSGPMAQLPAYDIVAQAMGGTMSVTGQEGGEPLRSGVSIGDLTGALYAVIAVLSALRVRDATGRGQHIDLALLDCQVALLEGALARYSTSGRIPRPLGNRHAAIAPFQSFSASDGIFVIAIGNDSLWRRLCETIGRPELADDPSYAINQKRVANIEALDLLLRECFATRPRDHWLGLFAEAGIPSAPVADIAEVSRNPQLLYRKMILNAGHPAFPGLMVPGSPLKFAGSQSAPNTRAPALGEHTERILGRLPAMSAERMAQLKAKGII